MHCRVRRVSHKTAPWRVSFPLEEDGRQRTVRKGFADENAAWVFAEDKDREIDAHGVRFGSITPEIRRAVDHFRDARMELEAEGVNVPSFEDMIRDGVTRLRAEHAERQKQSLTVADAVEAFIEYKRPRVGERQQIDLRDRLKRFAETYGKRKVATITTAEVEKWLAGLQSRRNPNGLTKAPLLSPQGRNHYRAALHAFFSFGATPARGWCESNPLTHLEPEQVKTSEPRAYPIEDVRRIMQAALEHRPDVLPVLVLGFYAGLRVSEATEIDVATIPSAGGEFRVPSGKTGPRLAWMAPCGRTWLDSVAIKSGKAWHKSRRMLVDGVRDVLTAAGVDGIDNGARHSFISYRTAELRDVARVADECGNSPQVIRAHYRELVTSEAASRYFKIMPKEKADNITKIKNVRRTA
jgi:site-specific recombinase XerD